MRDIKYRAKIKNPLKPPQAEWLYGYVSRNKRGQWFIDTLNEDYIEIEEKSVGEYIGLKDKNGKDVFDGDILKVEGSKRRYVVRWNKEELAFTVSYKYATGEQTEWIFSEFRAVLKMFEIIGNIYENPELLTA